MVQRIIKYLQQFLYQGERLLDEQGWREEAKGVIKEIVNFVKVLTVSDQLKYRYKYKQTFVKDFAVSDQLDRNTNTNKTLSRSLPSLTNKHKIQIQIKVQTKLFEGFRCLRPTEGILHWNLPEPRHPWGLRLHNQVEREGVRGGWKQPGHKQHRGVRSHFSCVHFLCPAYKSWTQVENMFCWSQGSGVWNASFPVGQSLPWIQTGNLRRNIFNAHCAICICICICIYICIFIFIYISICIFNCFILFWAISPLDTEESEICCTTAKFALQKPAALNFFHSNHASTHLSAGWSIQFRLVNKIDFSLIIVAKYES